MKAPVRTVHSSTNCLPHAGNPFGRGFAQDLSQLLVHLTGLGVGKSLSTDAIGDAVGAGEVTYHFVI